MPSPFKISPYKLPAVTRKHDGSPRRVGFELEFSGLTLEETAAALQASLGGELEMKSAAEQVLHVERLGDFGIELDWSYLKRKAEEAEANGGSDEWLEMLSQAAAMLVPVEVVCPPVPITELDCLETFVAALREAGAVGTEESLLAAYGVHINIEIPRLDAATLLAYLKAFAILQWWLVEAHDVDLTRRISPYIDLYGEAYLHLLLSKRTATMAEIIDDYLAYNASRNRALDLLPLLAEVDEKRVRSIVDDPRVKARPTFHYRMPNCHIERLGWSLALSWNRWCVVEDLAQRPDALQELSAAFLDAERPLLGVSRSQWVEFVGRWLEDRKLA